MSMFVNKETTYLLTRDVGACF